MEQHYYRLMLCDASGNVFDVMQIYDADDNKSIDQYQYLCSIVLFPGVKTDQIQVLGYLPKSKETVVNVTLTDDCISRHIVGDLEPRFVCINGISKKLTPENSTVSRNENGWILKGNAELYQSCRHLTFDKLGRKIPRDDTWLIRLKF